MLYTRKKIIHLLLPWFIRTRLFWFYKSLKFVLQNQLSTPRSVQDKWTALLFKDYLRDIVEKHPEMKSNLISGLDEVSRATVETVLDRQLYICENNILEQGSLFTPEEILEQKISSRTVHALMLRMCKYNFPATLSVECFYGLSGLKWLPEEVKHTIKEGIFIDVGAYVGDSSLFLSEVFSPVCTYAFEPERQNYLLLEDNIRKSKRNNIFPVNAGLADVNASAYIVSRGGMSYVTETVSGEQTNLNRLDDYLSERDERQRVSLIKMDIEGAELLALKGALATIKRHKPVLAISIYHNPADFFTIKPWLASICPDYKFMIRKATPFSLTGEVMLVAFIH